MFLLNTTVSEGGVINGFLINGDRAMASGHVLCPCWSEMTGLIFLAIDDAIAMLFCMIIYANLCLCHYVGEVTLWRDLSAPSLCLLAHPSIKLVT